MLGLVWQVLAVVTTVGFFSIAAEAENKSRVLWAGSSLGLWGVAIWGLGWGLFAGLGLQVGLFVALTLLNMLRK